MQYDAVRSCERARFGDSSQVQNVRESQGGESWMARAKELCILWRAGVVRCEDEVSPLHHLPLLHDRTTPLSLNL